jgi:hypothetical protein
MLNFSSSANSHAIRSIRTILSEMLAMWMREMFLMKTKMNWNEIKICKNNERAEIYSWALKIDFYWIVARTS